MNSSSAVRITSFINYARTIIQASHFVSALGTNVEIRLDFERTPVIFIGRWLRIGSHATSHSPYDPDDNNRMNCGNENRIIPASTSYANSVRMVRISFRFASDFQIATFTHL